LMPAVESLISIKRKIMSTPDYNSNLVGQVLKTYYVKFVQACHKVCEYGLVRCSSGNMSWRVQPDIALLSGSGAWLERLTTEHVSVCEIQTGQLIDGAKATCESGFHLGILAARPEVNVVLHFQSPYATAVACGDCENTNFNLIIEVPVYIGTPIVVPYFPPGSEELAKATVDALTSQNTNMAVLKNHGLVTVGRDFDEAIEKACFFELACQILLTNPNALPLEKNAVGELRKLGQA